MSLFRLWLHEKISRLDGTRERRFLAWMALAIFLAVGFGPRVIKAIIITDGPLVTVEEIGTAPVPNPVLLRAFAANGPFVELQFLLRPQDGTEFSVNASQPEPTTDPLRWETLWNGVPGQTYSLRAIGKLSTGVGPFQSVNTVTFSIQQTEAPDGGNTPPPPEQTTALSLQQPLLVSSTGNLVDLLAIATGPALSTVHFLADRSDGFHQEFSAEPLGDGGWKKRIELPYGFLYQIVARGRDVGGRDLFSSVQSVSTPPESSTGTAPPTIAPHAELLGPIEGFSGPAPIPLAARVFDGEASSLTFEVESGGGLTVKIDGIKGSDDVWRGDFGGWAGSYKVRARTQLKDGTSLSTSSRNFSIAAPTGADASATGSQLFQEPPPTSTAEAAPTTSAATSTVESATSTAPFLAAQVELLPLASTFSGPVGLAARVLNAEASQLVFLVNSDAFGETIVVGAKQPDGLWTGRFDGKTGAYRVRARATSSGIHAYSDERGFKIALPTATEPAPSAQTSPAPTTTAAAPEPAPVETMKPAAAATTTQETTPAPAPTPAPVAAAPTFEIPPTLLLECRDAGVSDGRCAEWLKAKYQETVCLKIGATTREACEAYLKGASLPVDERTLFGFASKKDLARADEAMRSLIGKSVAAEELPPEVKPFLSFEPRTGAGVFVLRPAPPADPARETSPALVVLDADLDGLPDDVEARLGTDPRKTDTDDDGFSDAEEVRNGYNPLGGGKLGVPLRGVEEAIINARPIEEPRGAGETDPSFAVAEAVTTDEPSTPGEAPTLRLSGKAAPNTVVTLFIYSYLPVVVTTTTDADGNWTYDFSSKLAEGRHEAYVSVNDDTGKLVAASAPLAFFVRTARAVSEDEFLRPDVDVEEAPASQTRLFLIGGGILVLLAIGLAALIVRQVRSSPSEPPGVSGTL
jgi:hypothetical protein